MSAFAKGCIAAGCISYLFYHSFLAFIFLVPFVGLYLSRWQQQYILKKRQEFMSQFSEALRALSAALSAGYSVENSIRESRKELLLLYDANARIVQEFMHMERELKMNMSVEKVLEEFAGRVCIEEVNSFVTVFKTSKRTGGDQVEIIRDTVRVLQDSMDVKREIHTLLASKRFEFRIMTVIPLAILGYMQVAFPEFMSSMYHSIPGVCVMSVCLGIDMTAYCLGEKIMNISV